MELVRIAADNDNIDLAPFTKVLGLYLVGGSDAAQIDIHDALTVTGDPKISLKTPTVTSSQFNFPHPGIVFKTGISVNITGTAAVAYLLVQ